MATDFSRTLSLLRSEKGISQRAAAKDLGISQALMSHYENGAREPGLAFVAKVCDYYHVSADYLLGRTSSPDGAMIDTEMLYDSSEEKGTLKGSVLATLHKKLVVNCAGALFNLLGKMDNRDAITAAGNYLTAAMYQMLRSVYRVCGGDEKLFAVDPASFDAGIIESDMQLSKTKFLRLINADKTLPTMSSDALTSLPGMGQSVAQVFHATDERAKKLLDE